MTFIFLRAAAITAAIFLFATTTLALQAKLTKANENHGDLIEKAQNLLLQKKRPQALATLIRGLKNEKTPPKQKAQLKKTVDNFSQVFLSEKAQQLYEVSLSLKKPDLPQAQQKIQEALKVEGDNLTLIMEAARQALAQGECRAAEDLLQDSQELLAFVEELKIVTAQTYLCLGQKAKFAKIHEDLSQFPDKVIALSLEIDLNLRAQQTVKAKELTNQLKKLDKDYPEAHYWSWRLDKDLKPKSLEAAQKYLISCRNLSSAQARRWNLDPWLCRRVAEVEAYLKTNQ